MARVDLVMSRIAAEASDAGAGVVRAATAAADVAVAGKASAISAISSVSATVTSAAESVATVSRLSILMIIFFCFGALLCTAKYVLGYISKHEADKATEKNKEYKRTKGMSRSMYILSQLSKLMWIISAFLGASELLGEFSKVITLTQYVSSIADWLSPASSGSAASSTPLAAAPKPAGKDPVVARANYKAAREALEAYEAMKPDNPLDAAYGEWLSKKKALEATLHIELKALNSCYDDFEKDHAERPSFDGLAALSRGYEYFKANGTVILSVVVLCVIAGYVVITWYCFPEEEESGEDKKKKNKGKEARTRPVKKHNIDYDEDTGEMVSRYTPKRGDVAPHMMLVPMTAQQRKDYLAGQRVQINYEDFKSASAGGNWADYGDDDDLGSAPWESRIREAVNSAVNAAMSAQTANGVSEAKPVSVETAKPGTLTAVADASLKGQASNGQSRKAMKRQKKRESDAKTAVKEVAIKGSPAWNYFDAKNLLVVETSDGKRVSQGFCVGNDVITTWHSVDPDFKSVSAKAIVKVGDKRQEIEFKKVGEDVAIAKGAKAKYPAAFTGIQSLGFSPYKFLSGAQLEVYRKEFATRGSVVSFQDVKRDSCAADGARFITYEASTHGGVSGAPVFVDSKLVAIHIEGDSSKMLNTGELLAPYLN